MADQKSCFDCAIFHQGCKIHDRVKETIPVNDSDPNYNQKFKKLFESLAGICSGFEPEPGEKDG